MKHDITEFIKGVVHVHGPPGVGKTLFGLTSAPPENIIFMDADAGKGRVLAEQLGVMYIDIEEELERRYGQVYSDLDYFNYLESRTAQLAKDNLGKKVLVADAWTKMFAGAYAYTKAHATKYSDDWAGGTMKGMRQRGFASKEVIPRLLVRLTNIAPLVIFLSHERDDYDQNSVKTGMQVPDQTKIMDTKAVAQVRLMLNPDDLQSPLPIGLTIKRFPIVFVDGKVVNAVPQRISPCTMEKIWEYYQSPVGLRELTDSEKLRDDEFSIIQGALSAEQRRQYETAQKIRLEELRTAQLAEDNDIRESAEAMLAQFSGPPAFAAATVKKKLAEGYPHVEQARIDRILSSINAKESGNDE